MGLVASGSSLGGILHPIMLNILFHKGDAMDGAGFAGGVRASAGLVAGMQVVAGLLMRARYDRAGPGRVSEKSKEGEQKTPGLWESVRKFSRDMAYIALVSGYVDLVCRLNDRFADCEVVVALQDGSVLARSLLPHILSSAGRDRTWSQPELRVLLSTALVFILQLRSHVPHIIAS